MTSPVSSSEAEHPAASEPSPDSGQLRVSHKTACESGIPPARDRLKRRAGHTQGNDDAVDQLELVLVESTRAEANLGLLLRGLKHLANGASAARESNAILVQELEALRIRVSKVYENERLLEKSVETLENALDAAARERDSWFEQEDEFLAGLLTEHEEELQRVQRNHERRIARLDEALIELRTQRDNSRAEVTQLIYERDAAVALLNEPAGTTERAPSPTPPSFAVAGSSKISSNPLAALRPSRPPLKSKPPLSSRPLIGYSVGDGVSEERLDSRPPGSRPPRS